MTMKVQLLSVNLGQPRYLGLWKGRERQSSIAKQPVTTEFLYLGELGLEGNQQSDLRVHGGIDKAVYAYPSEHFPLWEEELGRPFGPGSFGENLTIAGILEADAHIGDRWLWGEAVMEVTKPRQPCFKLVMHSGISDMIQRMRSNLRSGWYLKVVQPGRVPVEGPVFVIPSGGGQSIRDNFAAKASKPLSPDFLG